MDKLPDWLTDLLNNSWIVALFFWIAPSPRTAVGYLRSLIKVNYFGLLREKATAFRTYSDSLKIGLVAVASFSAFVIMILNVSPISEDYVVPLTPESERNVPTFPTTTTDIFISTSTFNGNDFFTSTQP